MLGEGDRITLKSVLSILEKLLKKKLEVDYIEKQKGNARDIFINISKAPKELGYRTRIGLGEGLKEEIFWLQERR